QPLESVQTGVLAEQRVEQRLGALRRQRLDADLPVIALAAPSVPVLRTIVDEEEKTCRGEAVHQAVEQGLGLGVDPVQVLEDDEEGLDLTLAQEQTLDAVERSLATLSGLKALPFRLLDGNIEQPQERGEEGLQRAVEGEQSSRHLFADLPCLVA